MNAKICFECFYYAINNLPFQLYLKFQAYIVARLLRLVSDMNLRLLDRIFPRIFLGQIELSGQIFLRLPNRVPRFCTRAFCCELDEIFHSVKKKLQKNIKLCESDLLHLWREILPCQLLRLIMLWYLRKKCNSPFGFLNIGRLLIGCVSESTNQKRQKIWFNGFFWKYSMT